MKSLRLTGRPDPAFVPDVFRLVADSEPVHEARLWGWNLAGEADVTLLFAVDGDVEEFRAALPDSPEILGVDIAPLGTRSFALLLRIDTTETAVFGEMVAALRQHGLVVVKPVVYRDGEVHARIVGETVAVQTFVDAVPPPLDVVVHEIGRGVIDPADPAAVLSDRQREAVLAALELGYYDSPKRATHEDVARALDCAPSTASEHLQKAAAKLVRGTMQPSDRVG